MKMKKKNGPRGRRVPSAPFLTRQYQWSGLKIEVNSQPKSRAEGRGDTSPQRTRAYPTDVFVVTKKFQTEQD